MLKTIRKILLLSLMLITTACSKKNTPVIDWKIAGNLPSANGTGIGLAGPVAGVHNGVLIIGGGANFPDSMPWLGGKKKYHDDVYVFRKENDSVLFVKSFKLPISNAYSASCSTPKGVCYAGGENSEGLSSKTWMASWNDTLQFENLPDLPTELTNAIAISIENKIYLAGGETVSEASKRFFTLDLEKREGWKELRQLPLAVSHAVLLSVDDSGIYLVGGRRKNSTGISELYSSLWFYDIYNNQWSQRKSLPYALSAGTGYANGDKLFVFGGDNGETFTQVEKHIAAINEEENDSIKQRLNEKKNHLLANHPGFSKNVLMYDTDSDEWSVIGSVPFDVPVTTTAVQWGKDIIIPSGEIRAGVRTANILRARFK